MIDQMFVVLKKVNIWPVRSSQKISTGISLPLTFHAIQRDFSIIEELFQSIQSELSSIGEYKIARGFQSTQQRIARGPVQSQGAPDSLVLSALYLGHYEDRISD